MDVVPSVAALADVPLDPHQRMIVAALVKAFPRHMTAEAIANSIYRHRADGGPETALQTVRVQISRLRRALPAYGWTIPLGYRGRGNIGEYRWEPVR